MAIGIESCTIPHPSWQSYQRKWSICEDRGSEDSRQAAWVRAFRRKNSGIIVPAFSFLLGGGLLLLTGNLVKRCSCCSGFGLLVNGLGFGFGGINQKVSGCENIFSYDCTVSQS